MFLQNDGPPGAIDEPGTPGWVLAVGPSTDDVVVRKQHDSGFAGTDLMGILSRHQVEAVSICGVMSKMCVAATARDALQQGLAVVLAHDSHGTYPVPAYADGEPEVTASQAARAAEWALGDDIHIPPCAVDVQFGRATEPEAIVS